MEPSEGGPSRGAPSIRARMPALSVVFAVALVVALACSAGIAAAIHADEA